MGNNAPTWVNAIGETQKAKIDAQIVTGTLDTLNSTAPKTKSRSKGKIGGGDITASYELQKSVLSSVYGAKGAIAELKG